MIETSIFNMLTIKARKIDFDYYWSTLFKYAASGDFTPVLEVSEVVSGQDEEGRRFVIIGIEHKVNIIFFERYKTPEHKFIIHHKTTKIHEHNFTVVHDIDLDSLIGDVAIKQVCEVIKEKFKQSGIDRRTEYNNDKTFLIDFL